MFSTPISLRVDHEVIRGKCIVGMVDWSLWLYNVKLTDAVRIGFF
jgi:hypothetical protein